MAQFVKLCHFAWAMVKAGTLSWGGAQGLLPFMYADCVEKHKWITEEHFSELVAVDTATPGVFAMKLAAIIGWEIGGLLGLLVGVVALCAPCVALFIVFFNFIQKYRAIGWVKSLINGVQYGAVGMIAYSLLKVLPTAEARGPALAFATGLGLVGLVFASLHFKWTSPEMAILGSAVLGVMLRL